MVSCQVPVVSYSDADTWKTSQQQRAINNPH